MKLVQSSHHPPNHVLEPLLEEQFGWRCFTAGDRTFWFRGAIHGRTEESLAQDVEALNPGSVIDWLDGLNGHFSLVIIGPDFSLAAVDPVRSYPLIWAQRGAQILVTHSGSTMRRQLELGPTDIDPAQADAFALSGFTIGATTIYRDVHQLVPGTFLLIQPGHDCIVAAYHTWRPTRPSEATAGDLVEPLSCLNERLISDLVASAAGRPILVPLSAGVDSRFVVSGLAAAGYTNVQCLAYGRPGNREMIVGREIAQRLGFEWDFVPYSNKLVAAAWATADHQAHYAYADSLTAIPFPQDYPALATLRAEGRLDPDSIVVNGQSGDFTSGNHIPAEMIGHDGGTPEKRLTRILNALIAKHFKHWSSVATPERMARIKSLLAAEIDRAGGLPSDPERDHGVYEFSEFIDRQAKYVVNGQRVYEYMGLSWRLPLWDRASLDFWEGAPLEAKTNQRLYREVLVRDNWGGVWRDIPINPTRLRPLWLNYGRLLMKALHAPLGAARWHRFERRYLNYWMSPLCAYAAWPYRQVVNDRHGAHGAIAFHIRAYMDRIADRDSLWFPR